MKNPLVIILFTYLKFRKTGCTLSYTFIYQCDFSLPGYARQLLKQVVETLVKSKIQVENNELHIHVTKQ